MKTSSLPTLYMSKCMSPAYRTAGRVIHVSRDEALEQRTIAACIAKGCTNEHRVETMAR